MSMTYIAADGSYGDAHGLVIVDTSAWTDADWNALDGSAPTPAHALAITAKYDPILAAQLADPLPCDCIQCCTNGHCECADCGEPCPPDCVAELQGDTVPTVTVSEIDSDGRGANAWEVMGEAYLGTFDTLTDAMSAAYAEATRLARNVTVQTVAAYYANEVNA